PRPPSCAPRPCVRETTGWAWKKPDGTLEARIIPPDATHPGLVRRMLPNPTKAPHAPAATSSPHRQRRFFSRYFRAQHAFQRVFYALCEICPRTAKKACIVRLAVDSSSGCSGGCQRVPRERVSV